jgi:hypothetical protein
MERPSRHTHHSNALQFLIDMFPRLGECEDNSFQLGFDSFDWIALTQQTLTDIFTECCNHQYSPAGFNYTTVIMNIFGYLKYARLIDLPISFEPTNIVASNLSLRFPKAILAKTILEAERFLVKFKQIKDNLDNVNPLVQEVLHNTRLQQMLNSYNRLHRGTIMMKIDDQSTMGPLNGPRRIGSASQTFYPRKIENKWDSDPVIETSADFLCAPEW